MCFIFSIFLFSGHPSARDWHSQMSSDRLLERKSRNQSLIDWLIDWFPNIVGKVSMVESQFPFEKNLCMHRTQGRSNNNWWVLTKANLWWMSAGHGQILIPDPPFGYPMELSSFCLCQSLLLGNERKDPRLIPSAILLGVIQVTSKGSYSQVSQLKRKVVLYLLPFLTLWHGSPLRSPIF